MKKTIVGIGVACLILVFVIVRTIHSNTNDHETIKDDITTIPVQLDAVDGKSISSRKLSNQTVTSNKLTRNYALVELELFGSVPKDASERTWRLCENTSWWGTRIDPKTFWSNRVVWLSREAEEAANRQGRLYPPIPSGETRFLDRSDKDLSDNMMTSEGRGRAYYSSDREDAYWFWFQKNMPRPPESIEWALGDASGEWMTIKNRKPIRPVGAKRPPPSQEDERSWLTERYTSLGFPKEAFSSEVLDWEYVRRKRKDRESILLEQDDFRRNMLLETFNQRLACPESLVVSESSDEEIRVTTGWRVDYLRRLRREGTDESYIEAYKKAWNLSEDDLKDTSE